MNMDVDQSFPVVNNLFVLRFENNAASENKTRCFYLQQR